VEGNLPLLLGHEPHAAGADRLDRRRRQLGHVAEPLLGDERLDSRAAPLAVTNGVAVRLALLQPAVFVEPRYYPPLRLLLR
jgi:hypothetical protein